MFNFFKKDSNSLLYDTYKPFLFDEKHVWLNSEGWYKLIHYLFDDKIKDEFNLIPIKNGCWADTYNDGRRRVISLFHINTSFATFKWGWNFEYIPHYTSKITWCRTDKSIYTHTFELSPKFINRKGDNYTVFGKFESKYKNNSKGFQKFVSDHLKVWDTVYEAIVEYYDATSTYEKMLNRLEENQKDGYYSFILPTNSIIYAFVKKYIHSIEAEDDFQKILFVDEKVKEAYYKAFSKIKYY